MSVLPRMAPLATDTDAALSLVRHIQLNTVLETGLDAVLGHGIVSGGTVTQTAPLSISLAAGTVLFQQGASYELETAQSYSIPSQPLVYVWAAITRTAASKTEPTSEDTYACTITHTLTATAPGDEYTPIAVVQTSGGSILAITEPEGKYLDLSGSTYHLNGDVTAISRRFEALQRCFDLLLLDYVQTLGRVPAGLEQDLSNAARRI